MKLSHFSIIITVLFAVIFWINSIVSQNNVAATTSNKEYSMVITNACYDAMKTINVNKPLIFDDEQARKKAFRTFYKTILKGLDKDNGLNDDYISEQTPFVLLLDNNGYYLSYNTRFDTSMTIGETEKLASCTGLNTWATTIDNCKIRFFLNDYIEVIDTTGKVYKGSIKEVSEQIPLSLFADDETFNLEKRYCVIHCMEDTINYLLNTQSVGTGSYRIGYSVSLSEILGEDFTRMIKNPTIIGFLQGPNKNNFTNTINIYGYAAAEETRGQLYYSEGGLYYRADDYDLYTEETVSDNDMVFTTYKYKDNIGNMENLAGKGNDPDVSTYRNQSY